MQTLLLSFLLLTQEVAPPAIPDLELVPVPAGRFVMGSDGPRDHFDEAPAHEVTISTAFRISATEITEQEFREFRPDFETTPGCEPYAAGVSWEDATAFCEWLSRRDGRPYRLPTEAEWEYVARSAASLGVRNLFDGVREWCHDRYGPYPEEPQTAPVGPVSGLTRVVRGGLLDDGGRLAEREVFDSPTSRASTAPDFAPQRSGPEAAATGGSGLFGTWYGGDDFTRPQEVETLLRLDSNWINDVRRGRSWSARWRGSLEAPVTGLVTFELQVATAGRFAIAEALVLDAMEGGGTVRGSLAMVAGERSPVELDYLRRGPETFVKVLWSWDGQPPVVIPQTALSHSAEDVAHFAAQGARARTVAGAHSIGFRVVQAPLPETSPTPEAIPFVRRGVRRNEGLAKIGPSVDRPYFRKRYLLPTPFDNSPPEAIDAVGFPRAFRPHNHSPALEVCPNGDLLLVIYTSYTEYEPEVSLIASRLRFGVDRWDFPEVLVDLAGVNDHAPLLWTDRDRGRVHLFWGSPRLVGGFPFQWTYSDDSGASWAPVRFPRFEGPLGPHSRQPINTAFRDRQGTFFLSSDGDGGTSLLWSTTDEGSTWRDTGGRSAGRHTSFALLGDGATILGLGGKNTDIDGWMPGVTSTDHGATWEVKRMPFPALGTNQRPSLQRLESGRLLFAADWQHFRGHRPEGVESSGSYVALSQDDGESWHFKTLPGVQPHEDPRYHGGAATLGYSALRQAPNGTIHLVTTMNRPCLHLAFNEAWILSDDDEPRSDEQLRANTATRITSVETRRERLPDGTTVEYTGGVADDGRFLLHGEERWTSPEGKVVRRARYELGRPVGTEFLLDASGAEQWRWEHASDGSDLWSVRLPHGRTARSRWVDSHAEGSAEIIAADGTVESAVRLVRGELARE